MNKIKSHKSVEEIAKKHNVDISLIQRQLKMGEKVEKEHTQNLKLARNIALQHLDEIPNYYSKLKKIESSKKIKKETASGDETLRDWFTNSSGTVPKTGKKKKGWRQIGGPFAGAPCARQEGQKSTPKCGSSKMAKELSPEEEEEAFERKNRKDPNQPQKSGGAKPTYVKTESMEIHEKKGEKDACYHKVKSRYSVWPSAYSSGALTKCRKVGAKNWGTKTEEISIVEKILGEEKCGEGMYWCNTDKVCKPIPQGFNVPGQTIKPTEVGIGKPVNGAKCNHTKKGKKCPIHGTDDCSMNESSDHEYSMIRSELSTIRNAIHRLQKKVKSGEGDVEAWVQSKITKAADYLDSAADYVDSGEMKENNSINEKCWPGYKRKKGTKKLSPGSCVKAESATIEDAKGNTFAEIIDVIPNKPIEGFKSQIKEATHLKSQIGNVIMITLMWKGNYYTLKMFFPQIKLPTRKELNLEIQKVYPGGRIVSHVVSELESDKPLIQTFRGGSSAKVGQNKNYIKPMREEFDVNEEVKLDKSKMKCNKPKAQAVGDSLTGKSHVVKACEGGTEKIIRFGQRGVKGSPKKKGESKAYASRRHRFQSRHAKNIAKGKMSAAYWANKVKW